MKKHIIAALYLVLSNTMFTPSSNGQDFRNITWGMEVEEVKEIEGKNVVDENENVFVYEVQVEGLDALLFYKHIDGEVISGGYAFQSHYSDKNTYIHDFEELKGLLTDQYGGPVSDEVLWKNDWYREDEESYGFAVGMGYLIYVADWDAGDTRIELALHGFNSRHFLAMNYASAAYEQSAGQLDGND